VGQRLLFLKMPLGRNSGVSECCDLTRARDGLDQYFQPLAVKLRRKQADAGDVAAGLCEGSGETFADQILAHAVQRYGAGRSLKHAHIGLGTAQDDVGRGLHQRRGVAGNLLGAHAVAADHLQVLAFHEAIDTKFIEERRDGFSRGGDQYAEAVNMAGLLGSRREWQYRSTAQS
jgi:hypothetical protein